MRSLQTDDIPGARPRQYGSRAVRQIYDPSGTIPQSNFPSEYRRDKVNMSVGPMTNDYRRVSNNPITNVTAIGSQKYQLPQPQRNTHNLLGNSLTSNNQNRPYENPISHDLSFINRESISKKSYLDSIDLVKQNEQTSEESQNQTSFNENNNKNNNLGSQVTIRKEPDYSYDKFNQGLGNNTYNGSKRFDNVLASPHYIDNGKVGSSQPQLKPLGSALSQNIEQNFLPKPHKYGPTKSSINPITNLPYSFNPRLQSKRESNIPLYREADNITNQPSSTFESIMKPDLHNPYENDNWKQNQPVEIPQQKQNPSSETNDFSNKPSTNYHNQTQQLLLQQQQQKTTAGNQSQESNLNNSRTKKKLIVCDCDSEILDQVHTYLITHMIQDYEVLTLPGGPSAMTQSMFPEWLNTFSNTYYLIERNAKIDEIILIQSFSSILLKNLFIQFDVGKSETRAICIDILVKVRELVQDIPKQGTNIKGVFLDSKGNDEIIY